MVDIAHYYGIDRNPFNDEGVEGLFFPGGQRHQLLDELIHHSRYNNGLLIVSGHSGSGKTTLLGTFSERVSDDTDVVVVYSDPMMRSEQIESAILEQLEAIDLQRTASEVLKEFLQAHLQCHRSLLVLVDDAHQLSVETIEALLLLQQSHCDALQFVFFVETVDSWLDHLSKEFEPQVWRLSLFDIRQTEEYIRYRMETAGWDEKLPFSQEQLQDIFTKSAGLPKEINRLSLLALQSLAEQDSKKLMIGSMPVVMGASLLGAFLIMFGLYWNVTSENVDTQGQNETVGKSEKAPAEVDDKVMGAVDRSRAAPSKSSEIRPSGKKPSEKRKIIGLDVSEVLATRSEVKKGNIDHVKPKAGEASSAALVLKNRQNQKTLSKQQVVKQASVVDTKTPTKVVVKQPVAEVAPQKIVKPTHKQKKLPVSPYGADEKLLLSLPQNQYVIQLVAIKEHKRLQQFLRDIPPSVKARHYQRKRKGVIWYVVVSRAYADKKAAQRGITALPESLRKQKPWVKPVSTVQEEIRQR